MTRGVPLDHDQVLAMRASGTSLARIASVFDVHPDTVREILRDARSRGDARAAPDTTRPSRCSFEIPRSIAHQLEEHAMERNVSPRGLAMMILTVVTRDNLFSAVLDG